MRNYLPAKAKGKTAPGCIALVARDKRLLELPFTLPGEPMEQWKLVEARAAHQPDEPSKKKSGKKNGKADKPAKAAKAVGPTGEWPWH